MDAIDTFRAKAPGVMDLLMADFGLNDISAAAILGNLGHECRGFTALQELNPVVKGSRGGWGWAQWTGPRRREFEAYCKRNNLDPASDKANYAFLFVELETTERAAIAALKAANGLDAKVEAFERTFLRAGVKHYPSRKEWARKALEAHQASKKAKPAPQPVPKPKPAPQPTKPTPEPRKGGWLILPLVALASLIATGFGWVAGLIERMF